jgi:hypothetical protein
MLFCLMGLVLSTSVLAQKTNKPPAPPPPSTPTDCKLGCTSNDVQIVKSYLSDDKGNKLGSSFICPQDGDADVYLTLELTTNTPRVGVVIYDMGMGPPSGRNVRYSAFKNHVGMFWRHPKQAYQ